MEMFSLVFSEHRLRNSSRMTKIVMPVCTHTDGRNFLSIPQGFQNCPPPTLPPYIFKLAYKILSSDIELNPGPDYPCGSCGSEVFDTDKAFECDNCCNWFHVSCHGIGESTYHSLIVLVNILFLDLFDLLRNEFLT